MLIPAITLLLSLSFLTLAGVAALVWLRPPRFRLGVLIAFVVAAEIGLLASAAAYSALFASPAGQLETRARVIGLLAGLPIAAVAAGLLAARALTARLRRPA